MSALNKVYMFVLNYFKKEEPHCEECAKQTRKVRDKHLLSLSGFLVFLHIYFLSISHPLTLFNLGMFLLELFITNKKHQQPVNKEGVWGWLSIPVPVVWLLVILLYSASLQMQG